MSPAAKKRSSGSTVAKRGQAALPVAGPLLADLRHLIDEARRSAAVAVNAGLTLLYWRVGERIRTEVLNHARADYGQQILPTLSAELMPRYGRGFSARSLWRMVQFAEAFADAEIVSTLSRHLGWSHFMELIHLKDPLARDFYAEMCRLEGWSVRVLRERIGSMLFERTALSARPEQLIRHELDALHASGDVAPDLVLKDPYVLDFLGLQDRYLEKDLEDAILRELETFLLELGAGFSFVARQRRIQLDSDDFYLDLLFYTPQAAAAGGHRTEARRVQARVQGPDGVVPALAGPPRPGAGRRHAIGHHPLHGQEARADRAARTRRLGHPRGRVPDRAAAARSLRAEDPQRIARSACAAGQPAQRMNTAAGARLGRTRAALAAQPVRRARQ